MKPIKPAQDINSNISLNDNHIQKALSNINSIILGKPQEIKLALSCLIAQGHLLIEDLPGVGKTTLAHTLAKVLGLHYQRIQFTSDLLPADILGVSIYQRDQSSFEFHPGPIFAQLVLADEVNRATPKTQSALLEAMEEYQVTIDGITRQLPQPFFVIATQNPNNQIGTFPLPESQLDRFLMKISLGYLDDKAERALLTGQDRRSLIDEIKECISPDHMSQLQQQVNRIHVSDALLDYLQKVLQYTRQSSYFEVGLSPRAGLSLKSAAQSWAMLHGRNHVLPEDLQAVVVPTTIHRLKTKEGSFLSEGELSEHLIKSIAIP